MGEESLLDHPGLAGSVSHGTLAVNDNVSNCTQVSNIPVSVL